MDRYERIVRLHRLLKHNRTGVSLERLMEEIEASRATVYRDIAFLRDALGAPIESDLESHRFKYVTDSEHVFELPGLWLSPDEVYALLVARQALTAQSDGALAEALGDLGPRLKGLVGDRVEHLSRIRVLRQASRKLDDSTFRTVTSAVLERTSGRVMVPEPAEGWAANAAPSRKNEKSAVIARAADSVRVIPNHPWSTAPARIIRKQTAQSLHWRSLSG